ncbi:MAG: TIGR02680 family protein [Actinobacteria bacterium]|nr:TIGR02680 family protein [Actinomycetota bacterium]
MSEPVAAAVAPRWRPVRAGIRNIWEYDDQVFEFGDGRLVLRGPNGSGKSNALALLVPFLLDGVMAANRMDSLGGGRSMRTLLLCLAEDERSGRFRHTERTGYAWLELERDGEFVTVGCGARASTQRDAEPWFFVTPRRPGLDLDLAPGGVPLPRGRLVEAIGAAAVHDSADAYRSAVDRALFGLGPHRYRNLVELLLVLRRPHLAGKLNLEHLSKVLSDGLAPLDDRLIADVAASFEDLEAVKDDLRRLREAHCSVEAFLPAYRRYLRATARSRATAMTETVRALRGARRRVVEAERALVEAAAEVERLRLARLDCGERREVAGQRQRAVLESPAYLDARSLAEVEERAAENERALAQADHRLAAALEEAGTAGADEHRAEVGMREASTGADLAYAATGQAADQAGVAWPLARDELEAPGLAETARGLGRRRRQDIADVRGVLRDADAAAVRARAAAEAAARSAEAAELAGAERLAAGVALDEERSALRAAVAEWARASALPWLEPVVEAVTMVGEPGAASLTDSTASALRPRREGLAAADARAHDQAVVLTAERDGLVAERRRVAEEPVPAPDRVATRPAGRAGRPGAPLYACCDFADGIVATDRAGLEAAIDAAGLLDAWVGEATDDLDAWLTPTAPVAAGGPTLADVLVATPPEGSGLTADAVRDVLRSVALAEAGIAVLPDGRFHMGPLSGCFAKPEAEFIGATAREQRRRRLMAELDERLAAVHARLAELADEREAIAAEQRRLDGVAGSVPAAAAVLAARDSLLRSVERARVAEEAAAGDAARARAARQAAEEQAGRLGTIAGERRLPPSAEGLAEADDLVHGYEQQANTLVQAVDRLRERRGAHQRAAARAARSRAALEDRRGERDDLHRKVTGLRARVEQLRKQLGPDAEAPLRELASIEEELRTLGAEAERLNAETAAAAERRGAANRERDVAAQAVAGHEAATAEAGARLDVLRRPDVWTVVAGDLAAPPEPAAVAGVVAEATAEVTDGADDNALQQAFRQLLDDLRRGYDPGLSYVDGVAVVEVTSESGTFSVLWLADQLGGQVARQEELLSERDREIFERHLLARVSEALRELLNDADELVTRINRSLADRPTASGKTVQLRWEPDTPDPGLRTALALLRRTPELLGPDERDRLRTYFSTAITQRRSEDAGLGYVEILRQVLDYRSWHVFVPHVRSAGGGVQRLTRTLFRTLSGGEQAVVLHLPLFAAAAAHYDSAQPRAPRLIALDEAFAGIDEGMRAELMGLLVRFDLDILLTGHELWGAYEQVPALMVYDLLRQPPLEGVSAFAVRWDGAVMAEV